MDVSAKTILIYAERRRGMAASSGIVPPRLASRFVLSLSIRALSPSFTSAVFSLIPVSSLARPMRISSPFIVVHLHLSTLDLMQTHPFSISELPSLSGTKTARYRSLL